MKLEVGLGVEVSEGAATTGVPADESVEEGVELPVGVGVVVCDKDGEEELVGVGVGLSVPVPLPL